MFKLMSEYVQCRLRSGAEFCGIGSRCRLFAQAFRLNTVTINEDKLLSDNLSMKWQFFIIGCGHSLALLIFVSTHSLCLIEDCKIHLPTFIMKYSFFLILFLVCRRRVNDIWRQCQYTDLIKRKLYVRPHISRVWIKVHPILLEWQLKLI